MQIRVHRVFHENPGHRLRRIGIRPTLECDDRLGQREQVNDASLLVDGILRLRGLLRRAVKRARRHKIDNYRNFHSFLG